MAVKVYPVVHVHQQDLAVEQSSLAMETSADGIFLIDHSPSRSTGSLIATYNRVRASLPGAFLGLNMLRCFNGLDAFRVLASSIAQGVILHPPDALWSDESFDGMQETQLLRENTLLTGVRYLGGVAFKYTQGYTDEPEKAAQATSLAEPYLDVITTSGPRTGVAPNPEKIVAMKQATTKPIAVASGISLDNIAQYKDSFDQLLVASSVEAAPGSGIFDRSRLHDLVQAAHEL